jgi:hypothetical protein
MRRDPQDLTACPVESCRHPPVQIPIFWFFAAQRPFSPEDCGKFRISLEISVLFCYNRFKIKIWMCIEVEIRHMECFDH